MFHDSLKYLFSRIRLGNLRDFLRLSIVWVLVLTALQSAIIFVRGAAVANIDALPVDGWMAVMGTLTALELIPGIAFVYVWQRHSLRAEGETTKAITLAGVALYCVMAAVVSVIHQLIVMAPRYLGRIVTYTGPIDAGLAYDLLRTLAGVLLFLLAWRLLMFLPGIANGDAYAEARMRIRTIGNTQFPAFIQLVFVSAVVSLLCTTSGSAVLHGLSSQVPRYILICALFGAFLLHYFGLSVVVGALSRSYAQAAPVGEDSVF